VKDFFHRRKSVIGIGIGSRKFGDNEGSIAASDLVTSTTLLAARDNPDLGPFLLKLAKQTVTLGDNPQKALDYATRAAKSFESAAYGKPSLDLVMSLHILAAIHCTLGQFEEAIPVLVRSIQVPDIEFGGQDHALAAFAGNMQLGDTYALLGQGEDALTAYHAALDVQKRALGDHDPRVAETCRYLAEAHAQVLLFLF
jgi:tetratricopeptide (TPR) repeat protein